MIFSKSLVVDTVTRMLWILFFVCSLALCVWFIQPITTAVNLQSDRYFDRFSEQEQSDYADFRWSFPQSQLLFPQRWVDFALFPSQSTAQIVSVHFKDMYQSQTMQVGGVYVQSDAMPRRYHVLTAQSSVVALQTSKVYLSPEQRELGVQVFAANRQSTRLSFADIVSIWVQIVLILLAILAGTAVLHYLIGEATSKWFFGVHASMWIAWWLTSPVGSGEFVMAWGFVAATLWWMRDAVSLSRWSWLTYGGVLFAFVLIRVGAGWFQYGMSSDVPLVNHNINFQLPIIWEPYWSWGVWLIAMWLLRWVAGRDYLFDWWLVLFSALGVLVSVQSNGYWPVHTWMYVISLEYLDNWQGVWDFLRTSRVAIPPLLLIIEFAIHNHTLLEIIYVWLLPRAILLVAMLLVVFRGITDWRERMIRGVALLLWLYAFTLVKTLDNYFIYDILFGAVLLFAVHLAYRKDIVLWQWAVVGVLLVLMDSMRPFGMVVLAVVGPWLLYRSWRMHSWQGMVLLALPLCLSVTWHAHHIINLGQMNWSNHTGYNVCNAWECPIPPDLSPEAPPVAEGLWPNINTEVHQHNSQRLLKSGIEYQLTHPDQTLRRAGELLLNILIVPYEPGTPALIGNGWWVDVYRIAMLVLMLLNVVLMVALARMILAVLRRRTTLQAGYFLGNMAVIMLVLVLPNLTEYGENYRFISGAAMWLAALPPWAEYRSFVRAWLPIRST